MTPARLERVKEVLDGALKRETAARAGFVESACQEDSALRREVESLLAQEPVTAPLLERPLYSLRTAVGDASEDREPTGPSIGQRIGPYQIVRMLGEGGMGTVALAVREDDFKKQAALKLVRPGMVSEEIVRRFHNERQILAQLEHPNIARILDGGTTGDGQPYFVMEYVEGEPIDEYCDRHQLPIRRRLELFCAVCSALHVAHQNLVVHRDLKPGNILVTAGGVPKLLDFGIAKQLTPEPGTQLTRLGQRPMTLRYASPEQIEGRAITTASDVYSSGVVLYQLLTGHFPYLTKGDSELELARVICEEEPRKPSTAVRQEVESRSTDGTSRRLTPESVSRTREGDPRRLRNRLAGDLDSIVLMALRKEPRRRYGSVEQLSEDIRRHLEGRPVVARKSTWSYRAGKFVHRHRLALAAAAVLVLLGIAFTATTLFQRQRSERARERSEQVVDFMKDLFRTANPNEAQGEELTAREILERGEKKIGELEDPLVRAELLSTIGEVYVNLGLWEEARSSREGALGIRRRYHRGEHRELAKAINNLAGLLYRLGDWEEAERLYLETLTMKRDLREDDVDIPKTMSNLATILMSRGEYPEAERLYREALEMRKRNYGPEDSSVATNLRSLGTLLYTRGELERAEPLLREALEIRRRIFGPEHTKVAAALSSLGRVLHAQGRYEEAEELLTRALEIRRTRQGANHPHVASSQRDLAALFMDLDEPATAEVLLVQALRTLRQSKGEGSWELADAESLLGALLTRRERFAEAEPYLVQSLRTLARIRGEEAVYTRNARRRLRELYAAWGKPEKAAEYP